jgi:hypothetical protein
MGLSDGYRNEGSFGAGKHELTIVSVKEVSSSNTGTGGLEFTYRRGSSSEFTNRKTLWQSKMFNRFLTSWITELGLKPVELERAVQAGKGDAWLFTEIDGASGIFDFCETDKVSEKTGKPFLEPKCKAEVEFDEWKASQNNEPKKQEQQTSHDSCEPPDFPDEIPF